MGCGIESTSWKYGMFNEICQCYEIVTCTGEVQSVTEESDKELFHTLPWSHGTHGILVSATLRIIPAKPFVRLQLTHCEDRDSLCKTLESSVGTGDHEFVEGLAFNPSFAVVMTGSYVDAPDASDEILSLGKWHDPWFFKQVQEKKKVSCACAPPNICIDTPKVSSGSWHICSHGGTPCSSAICWDGSIP